MEYPTPKEILNEKIILLKEEIEYFKKWKNREWKTAKKTQIEKECFKGIVIKTLIKKICSIHNKKCFTVICLTPATKNKSAYYDNKTKTIHLYDTSIITALHELGHHLYGKSELLACAYSVHLFKLVFPKAFKKLRWKNHTLIINKLERKPKK